MFDLSRIADAVGSFAGGGSTENALAGLTQQMTELGIDPAQLQGLAPQEIVDLLSQHGIELGSIDASQLSELAGQFGSTSDLATAAGQWFSDRFLRS